MLLPRIIPCLLIHNGGLYKTVEFGNPKYLGDPLNAVRIFNEKEVDELIVLDIDASRYNKPPDYSMIQNLANECRMPLCYGGGVNSIDQFEKIVSLGVEKIACSSSIVENPDLVDLASKSIGSQSVVCAVDIKKTGFLKKIEVVTHNATKKTGKSPVDWAKELQDRGAGELLLNFVDKDGRMNGYDYDFIDRIYSELTIPISVIGGAGSLDDIKYLFKRYGIIGAGVGSLFVFKGRLKAVLINYPSYKEKESLLE